MDLDERIEEFRNSLPEKKREAFDSLPHEYKQTLIAPEAIKKMAQAFRPSFRPSLRPTPFPAVFWMSWMSILL